MKKIKIKKNISEGILENTFRDSKNSQILNLKNKEDRAFLKNNLYLKNEIKTKENIKEMKKDNIKTKDKKILDLNKDGIPDDKNITDLSEIIRKRRVYSNKKTKKKEKEYDREREI